MITKKIDEIRNLLTERAMHFVSQEESVYFASQVIEDYMRKSPRVNPIESAINELETWNKNPDKKIEIIVDKKASLLINYNRLAPSIKIKWLHDELEKRAHLYGIAMAGIYNTGGVDWLSMYTTGLAKRGLIGIFMFNGGPGGVVPYGGTRGFFGTNPMSYAIPTNDDPILADMATSEIPFFEYSRAKKAQKSLSKAVRVTQEGIPTTDPENGKEEYEARLLPMGGGYKGYAINLLIEVLTGNFVQSVSRGHVKSPEYIPHEYGGLLIVFDIASFTELSVFKTTMTDMTKAIRNQKPGQTFAKVSVPGDASFAKQKIIEEKKLIDIDEEIYQRLIT